MGKAGKIVGKDRKMIGNIGKWMVFMGKDGKTMGSI